MKLNKEQKTKILDACQCSEYDAIKFSCYVDGIFTYQVSFVDDEKVELNIIPFNNLECFLSNEELGRLINLEFLFFECNHYIDNPETWERKEIVLVSINTNNTN